MSAAVSQLNQIPSPETIRDATREVLSRPEFTGPSSWEQIVIALLKAIGDWLNVTMANPGRDSDKLAGSAGRRAPNDR